MMSTKIVFSVLVCVFVAFAQSAPQFDQQFQPQQQHAEQQSRFAVLDGKFHQDPNLEYNFELVFCIGRKLFKYRIFFKIESLNGLTVLSFFIEFGFFRQRFANGEEFKEDGKFKTVSGMDVIVTKGSYTIVEKDGSITVVNYTADEHGFHPEVGKF